LYQEIAQKLASKPVSLFGRTVASDPLFAPLPPAITLSKQVFHARCKLAQQRTRLQRAFLQLRRVYAALSPTLSLPVTSVRFIFPGRTHEDEFYFTFGPNGNVVFRLTTDAYDVECDAISIIEPAFNVPAWQRAVPVMLTTMQKLATPGLQRALNTALLFSADPRAAADLILDGQFEVEEGFTPEESQIVIQFKF
jgi:hypothetical protein